MLNLKRPRFIPVTVPKRGSRSSDPSPVPVVRVEKTDVAALNTPVVSSITKGTVRSVLRAGDSAELLASYATAFAFETAVIGCAVALNGFTGGVGSLDVEFMSSGTDVELEGVDERGELAVVELKLELSGALEASTGGGRIASSLRSVESAEESMSLGCDDVQLIAEEEEELYS